MDTEKLHDIIIVECAAAAIEAIGMADANRQREAERLSPAYTQDDFDALADKLRELADRG